MSLVQGLVGAGRVDAVGRRLEDGAVALVTTIGARMPQSQSVSGRTSAALVLFCRRPAPGLGKQRLARALGETTALAIATALLECALEDVADWPGALIISPACQEDLGWAEALIARPKQLIPQPEGNLGQRLRQVDAETRRLGFDRVLFIGSDAPSLQLGDLLAAADALAEADAVLIPAADGGVTLMGSRTAWPDLAGLPWSEAALADALERQCRAKGRTVVRLGSSYDIDEVSDLARAVQALADDLRPARKRLRLLLVQACDAIHPAGGPCGAERQAGVR
jgi:uncharacterized protein